MIWPCSVPMHRLLQGDVGAGKTVVATAAMLQAVQAQNQAAMMAPTEVLAEQHYAGVAALVADLELDGAGGTLGNPAGALSGFSPRRWGPPNVGLRWRILPPGTSISPWGRTR